MSKTDTLRAIDPHETELVSGYRDPKLVGINEMFPIIEVNKEKGSYTEYGPDASVIRAGLEQPMGAGRKRIDMTIAKGEYNAVKVGIEVPLYDEEREEAADPSTLDEKKALLGEAAIQLGMEKTVADYVSNPANYAVGFTEALAGVARWSDYTNSDPVTDVNRWASKYELSVDAERDEIILALGPEVIYTLQNHPKLLSKFTANEDQVVTNAHLARWFGIKEVKTLRGKHVVTYDFKDPKSAVFAHLWGKVGILYRKIDSPSMDQPLWGAVTRRKGYPEAFTYRDDKVDADIKVVKDKWGLHVRANNRAFLGTTLIN